MAAKVIPMQPSKPANPSKVTPPAGWSVTSAYGSLHTYSGIDSGIDLVRLEDIHTEMCKGGKPPKMATYDIFHPFLSESINGHEKGSQALIPQVHATSAMSYPLVLFRDGVLAKQDHALPFGRLPELGHVRYEDGTTGGILYTLAEAALRVWLGGVDPATDHAEMLKAKKAEAEDRKYGVEWPSNEALRKVLGRLAVSHELAHQLWGWGACSEVVQLRAVAAEPVEPKTYSELVAFRGRAQKSEWTTSQKGIAATEANRRKASPGVTRVASTMAKELGVSVSRLNELIRNSGEAGKCEKQRTRRA